MKECLLNSLSRDRHCCLPFLEPETGAESRGNLACFWQGEVRVRARSQAYLTPSTLGAMLTKAQDLGPGPQR